MHGLPLLTLGSRFLPACRWSNLDDGERLASSLVPPLTTIERPDRAVAEQAVTMTVQRVDEDSEGQIPQYSFSCRAGIRDSMTRPRGPQRPPCRPADRR